MEAPQSYFAVLPVMALPDRSIREDQDTACAYPDVEEAISTARWLVGGGCIRVLRREYRSALGLNEDAEIIMKVGRFAYHVTPDCKFVIC
jgi:hypothetical protein